MRNPFKRGKKKRKSKKINKRNLDSFLREVTKSVDTTFDGQESNQLERLMRKEIQTWLKSTVLSGKDLNSDAILLGVCLGVCETLRKINEEEEPKKVTYIS